MSHHVLRISASLLAAPDIHSYDALLKSAKTLQTAGIDYLHYDVSDHPKTLHLNKVNTMVQDVDLPLDIHIATERLPDDLQALKLRNQDLLALQVENLTSFEPLEHIKHTRKCRIGLALGVDTPVCAIKPYADELDYVLLMAAEPGVSGGAFNESVLNKIDEVTKSFPHLSIHVDGGINHMTSALLRHKKVDVVISGSYIMQSEDYVTQVTKLMGHNFFQPVEHVMQNSFKSVQIKDDIQTVVLAINEGKLGCVCVQNENGRFCGIISDGDIRRFIVHNPDLTHVKATDLMTSNPFTVTPDQSLIQTIRTIEAHGYAFSVVPVIDPAEKKAVGMISLRDLVMLPTSI